MSDSVKTFLEASARINSRTLSLTRFQILTLLAYFTDGLQYRELKASLKISDGKLISNLRLLLAMRYVHKFSVEIDRKKLDVYVLTEDGRKELDKMTAWMKLAQQVTQFVGDGSWQMTLAE